MEEIQKAIQEAMQEAIKNSIDRTNNNIDKPIFEFVATYDAGSLTRYIEN